MLLHQICVTITDQKLTCFIQLLCCFCTTEVCH